MGESGRSLRLFVACALPGAVRDGLAAIQDEMRNAGFPRLRYVRPEGIHITLKFLGDVTPGRVGAVREALERAIEPFELRLVVDRLGGFPSTSPRAGSGGRLRVVWAGLSGDLESLAMLAGAVERALAPLGFPNEGRPFAPHLTLARVPDDAPAGLRGRLASWLDACKIPPLPSMIVRDVHLMQSFLGPGGSRYQTLASFPAAKASNA
jgi:2'-5' RNA ligase